MAHTNIVTIDGSNHVTNRRRGKASDTPSPPEYLVTQAHMEQMAAGGRWIPGSNNTLYRWEYTPGATPELGVLVDLVASDSRPTGTWSDTLVQRTIGMADTTVDLTMSAGFPGSLLEFQGGTFSPTIVAGVWTLTIKADVPKSISFGGCTQLRMLNNLKIFVYRTDEV